MTSVRKTFLVASLLVWATALSSTAVRISQIEFDLALARGAAETFTFQVTNNEPEPVSISITLSDWDRNIEGENRFVEPGTVPRSAARWIAVSPTQFNLSAEQMKDVQFSLRVPQQGVDGSYWAAILVEASPQTTAKSQGTAVVVRRRFAVKVYVTPPGTGRRDGRLTNVESRGLNPPNFMVEFENRGAINLPEVQGRLELRDEKGVLLETMEIASFPVLPGYKRQLILHSQRKKGDRLPPGRYVVLALLNYGGETIAGGQLVLRSKELKLAPIGSSKNLPKDLDADGFYEDVDGSGKLTVEDPALLGFNLDTPAAQNNWWAFDYNNDGKLNFDDVLTLKQLLEGTPSK